MREQLRDWRRSRPFWGALVLAAGGWYVFRPVATNWTASFTLGVGGVSGYLLGLGMIAAAGVALMRPEQRHFPAVMAALMSVASLPLANLGGWIIGMTLGIVGSAMIFGWSTDPHDPAKPAPDARVVHPS